MDAKTMQAWQVEIDRFKSRIEEMSEALQEEYDDMTEKVREGKKGDDLQLKIENLVAACDALDTAYSSLLE